jgi:V/A-type H+-transporting ATPase subunit K
MPKRLFLLILVLAPLAAALLVIPIFAAPEPAVTNPVPPDVIRWGFVAAAAAAGLSAIGAAYAVAVVGAAAMGAVAEKPETAGRALIFVGLAEGIAIYGLIIAIMILGQIG